MKKIGISCLLALSAITGTVKAQEVGTVRVGFDFGYTIPEGGGGISYAIEPKYNLQENMTIGLKLGAALMVKNADIEGSDSEFEGKIAANGSYLGTFDYYFHKSGSFAPYVGGGIGLYRLAAIEVKVTDDVDESTSFDASSKFGGLIRFGFESGKFRMGAEYNLIPKSDLEDINGNVVGESVNNYLNIHLGFYLGGGKWSNK